MNLSELPQIGQPLKGGFFAGLINCDGSTVAIIVAPKETGITKLPWGEYGKDIAANSYNDGRANTIALAESDSALGHWAIALNINDFNDWYLPARDELEIIYRNLKPTEEENYGYRSGENPSAIEPANRYRYSEELPAQTSVADFQSGGPEAFEDAWHWSSTQYSALFAWIQHFGDGYQDNYGKDRALAARAVRRELVI